MSSAILLWYVNEVSAMRVSNFNNFTTAKYKIEMSQEGNSKYSNYYAEQYNAKNVQ
jgi:hypothetical protein